MICSSLITWKEDVRDDLCLINHKPFIPVIYKVQVETGAQNNNTTMRTRK